MASAADDAGTKEPATIHRTQEGLHFNLPADWPIERRNGVVGPIPVEEYIAQKFKALEARLQAMEQRFNGFDVRLRVLEEESKARQKTLQSSGASAPR